MEQTMTDETALKIVLMGFIVHGRLSGGQTVGAVREIVPDIRKLADAIIDEAKRTIG